jgi:penicillin amidase
LPTPGWDASFDPDGFVHPDKMPRAYNPPQGFVATANEDLNHLGQANLINLPMGAYRADRIKALLQNAEKVSVTDMQTMHFDLFSIQAERFMKIIRPLLPDTKNGRILKDWDLTYHADSQGAMLFESVYSALINTVFGDNGLGRDVVDYITKETGMFNDYYANLDNILLQDTSAWFNGQDRDTLFKAAITEGLQVTVRPYGETRQMVMAHLLFGGQLPRWMGFDYGPIALPGSRATIMQGQIFKSAGRITTFSPSYRLIADMDTSKLHTTLAGGPSDRRFSKWYTSDIENWVAGKYKVLK